MVLIKLDDLKKWRADRIACGQCSFDDMTALGAFMDRVERYEVRDDYTDWTNGIMDISAAVDVSDKRR